MSGECQVNVKVQSELDIGGRETCYIIWMTDKQNSGVIIELMSNVEYLRKSVILLGKV